MWTFPKAQQQHLMIFPWQTENLITKTKDLLPTLIQRLVSQVWCSLADLGASMHQKWWNGGGMNIHKYSKQKYKSNWTV